MKKLNNPFTEINNYQCFGCSPDNKMGLQLTFTEDDDLIVSEWEPKAHFQGWINILHGGIQATLMDEIASWVVFVKLKTSGVTSKMDIRLKKAVYTNKGPLKITAKLNKMLRNIAVIDTFLYNSDGELCAQAEIHYFTYEVSIAKEKLLYPGYEKFMPNEE